MDDDDRTREAIVHQAAGMVSVQVECTIAEAIARLNIRAHASGLAVEEIAQLVVDRVVTLGPWPTDE